MIETALVLSRCLQFAAAMGLIAGASLFWGAPPRAGIDRALRGLALANLAGALGWFLAECAVANDGWSGVLAPDFLTAMLTDTRFGRVWGPHMLLALLAVAWPWRRHDGASVAFAGLNLGAIGLTGHAVLPPGNLGALHQALSVLHLLAGGYWVGSLPFILTLLGKSGGVKLLKRFSVLGHLAVATVLVTGLAKTAIIQTSRPDFDPAFIWGLLLAIKVLVVLTMTALALRNRYRLLPMGDAGLGALRRGTLAEIVLSVAVLSLISFAATLSPFAT